MRRTASIAAGLFLAAAVSGCATRLTGGVYGEEDGGFSNPFGDDMAKPPPPDLARPIDLAQSPDLAKPGKNCGQIMQCMIGCGAMLGACQAACFQGASPKGLQQAGALVACAAQKCFLAQGDMGGTNPILCLISKCGNEVAMCEGFGFGGGGGGGGGGARDPGTSSGN
ncbi:MAG: hypothetical protein EXR72_16180 [Myxococcales bacterium]|nr:hypothetical protein [Myxococcales bacterium]